MSPFTYMCQCFYMSYGLTQGLSLSRLDSCHFLSSISLLTLCLFTSICFGEWGNYISISQLFISPFNSREFYSVLHEAARRIHVQSKEVLILQVSFHVFIISEMCCFSHENVAQWHSLYIINPYFLVFIFCFYLSFLHCVCLDV